ncbi:MAG: heme-binding protein [Bacteroidetes bacterium]|nr:heme-binding protein [Bacteroidota bacterium]
MISVLLGPFRAVFGIRNAMEPDYQILYNEDSKEIRQYAGYVIAKTVQSGDFEESGNSGFWPLYRYITGANQKQNKIQMTAPVLQKKGSHGWEIAFVLPAEFTMENAPIPTDKSVTLAHAEPQLVGVLRYTGLSSEKKIARFADELLKWLQSKGYEPISQYRSARYDPPFTLPFFRRNEIHMELKK